MAIVLDDKGVCSGMPPEPRKEVYVRLTKDDRVILRLKCHCDVKGTECDFCKYVSQGRIRFESFYVNDLHSGIKASTDNCSIFIEKNLLESIEAKRFLET
jgi:hypothetical protein